MVSSYALPIVNGGLFFSAPHSLFCNHHSAIVFRWELRREQDARLVTHRTEGQAFCVLENPKKSPMGDFKKEVILVDPLEAKRLAAKQMEEIKAKEKFKRRRRIEAINGAWAMIGLTAGLVIEGHTGNGIVSQLAGCWEVIVSFFVR
ncbi:hypothetical protein F0562_009215 [Nyssa sinensis]|uniref:Uncharacterized protein n=1 Tax=Nyssa sinensis TaxID=561372 RepID=A0A5J4ZZC7_9ASTE|nr:hypothetical protein F0562_009215 [Nyssa sinensis]